MSDLDTIYGAYKAAPTPDNLSQVVHALHPTVDYALAQYGAAQDPLVRSKALLYTADAVEKYDPQYGASLPTHVSNQLRQLTRTVRQSRSPVRIPDRVQTDAYKLFKAEQSYRDEHGRDPDALELADFTGLPVKRIAKIRTFQVSVPSEGAAGDMESQTNDMDTEAMDYVYHAADHTDRKILEMKTGYGGSPVMQPKDIALALNLTPTQLTRRSIRMTQKINELKGTLGRI